MLAADDALEAKRAVEARPARVATSGELADARAAGCGLWLKLDYGEPGLDGWRQESWFASPKEGRPGFWTGDLVVRCAKSTHDCYAAVEVAEDPEYQPTGHVT